MQRAKSGRPWRLGLVRPNENSRFLANRKSKSIARNSNLGSYQTNRVNWEAYKYIIQIISNHFKLSLPNFYKSDRKPLRRLRVDSIPCLCWRTRGCHGSCRLSLLIDHKISRINSDRRIMHSEIQYWIAHASSWSSNPGLCESSVSLRILAMDSQTSKTWAWKAKHIFQKERGKSVKNYMHCIYDANDMWALMWPLSKTKPTLRYSSSKSCGFGATLMYWNRILQLLNESHVLLLMGLNFQNLY